MLAIPARKCEVHKGRPAVVRSEAERRAETRVPASGEVRLRPSGVLTGSFIGSLLDVAPSGFRARHACLTLTSGQQVDFSFADRNGLACVVWTQIVDGEAETGFRILRSSHE